VKDKRTQEHACWTQQLTAASQGRSNLLDRGIGGEAIRGAKKRSQGWGGGEVEFSIKGRWSRG
jgi:hypothetical protein